jgi:D-alanyl-D-alanine dipeptidase
MRVAKLDDASRHSATDSSALVAAARSTVAASRGASMLVSPRGILCLPKYVVWKIPGAIPHVWLQSDVVTRLERVDRLIRSRTKGRGRLLIWDGLRSMETQSYLYMRERTRIDALHQDKSPEQREAILNGIVRPPRWDKPPPHTTGGAVDCTIWFDDREDALGPFDDFTPRGRPDFFLDIRVDYPKEEQTAALRLLHREAMQSEGFIGIDTEWWHWEHGTRTWAAATNSTALYDTILTPPDTNAPAFRNVRTPARHPENILGIGQVFAAPGDRARSLRGEIKGHYYARTRHPNERQVAAKLGSLIGAPGAVMLPSGLSAAVMAVLAHVPQGGRVLLDSYTYYETVKSIRCVAAFRDWRVDVLDLSDAQAIAEQRLKPANVIFVDHPRNWLLTCPKLESVRQLATMCRSLLIVDTSVQPLQQLLSLGLADLVTLSLSKYPSAGQTAGGGVFGPDELLRPIDEIRSVFGQLLAPEAAATLLQYLPSLPDRLRAISDKARLVATFLEEVPFITDVRIPNLEHVGALPGGQITFLVAPETANRAEDIIAANTLDPEFPLAFACTFGASFTTFEHFDSRNSERIHPSIGSEHIEAGRIRLGIGHEDTDRIIESLRFALFAAQST